MDQVIQDAGLGERSQAAAEQGQTADSIVGRIDKTLARNGRGEFF